MTPPSETKTPDLPKVSIITPSYNQASFLEQAMRSVLAQDYANIEYIVIDGGSTDGSVELISRHAGQLASWASRPDKGQAHAINEGFRKATGKYVAWLNSDDLYLPGCILNAVQNLEAHPQAAMVFGQVEVINAAGRQIGMFKPVNYSFADLLTYKIIIPQQAAFFRRSSLEHIGFLDTNLHFALDHELFLRLGRSGPIINIPVVMAQYRLSGSNKGSLDRSKWSGEFLRILDKFFADPGHEHDFLKYKSAAYAGAYYRGACNLLDDGNYSTSRTWFLKTIKYQPSFLLDTRWWVNFVRTFLGKRGNASYLKLKTWLGKSGWLDVEYDWWTGLRISEQDETQAGFGGGKR